MLRIFFHRYSIIVRFMELIGLVGMTFIARQVLSHRLTGAQEILFVAVLMEYVFLRFCALYRWYPEKARSAGIGLQFEKAMVPASYIMALATWGFVLIHNLTVWIIALLLLSVILHVNVILLVLHFKDPDQTPVNRYGVRQ